MNQILYTEKPKGGGSLDIRKTAFISVIVIIVFAIVFIGKGVYGFVSNAKSSNAKEPIVTIREVNDKLELNISHDKTIDKIVYSWNGSNETTLQGRGRTQITEKIDIPGGSNVLNLKITDIDNQTATYTKSYYKDNSIDTTIPEIEFAQENSKVKIVVKDNKILSSVSYHWNDEDETVIDLNGQNLSRYEEKIDVKKGKNTLTVTAIDESGNKQTESQVYKGAKKPTISLVQNGNQVIITAADEENIRKIELTLNGEFFSTDSENTGASLDMQEAQITQNLVQGENNITITVYNVSDLSETVTQTITI